MKRIVKSKELFVCLIIGLAFLWTGSGYISWLYNLMDAIAQNEINASADVLTEVVGYIFQALGILLSVLYVRKKGLPDSKRIYILTLLIDIFLICMATLVNSFVLILICGYLMNIFHGIIAAGYLFLLNKYVSPGFRGITFGLAYSFGSIGSWILSLIGNGNYLQSDYALISYIAFMVLTAICFFYMEPSASEQQPSAQSEAGIASHSTLSSKIIILVGIGVTLLCITKGLGFYFPSADLTNLGISLEFSRAFYAIGLILARIVNDKKRRFGALLCMASLCIPFVMMLLKFTVKGSLILWITGYIFTGFFAVYRVIVFSDIADYKVNYFFLAPFGLMLGRLGDALGSWIGSSLTSSLTILVIVSVLFFVASVVICFAYFSDLYPSIQTAAPGAIPQTQYLPTSPEAKISAFSTYHDLSAREREVLPLIIKGNTNNEISSILFVSENTVKFHVRNILKKTGCSNRQELYKCFENYK